MRRAPPVHLHKHFDEFSTRHLQYMRKRAASIICREERLIEAIREQWAIRNDPASQLAMAFETRSIVICERAIVSRILRARKHSN